MAQPTSTTSNHVHQASSPRGRASVACESCKRRKCKCCGGFPCTACVTSSITCILDETLDRRRKIATKRALDDLETHKEVLDAFLQVIRSGDEQEILAQVRQNATLTEIADGLKKKLESGETTSGTASAISPISSTRQDMPSVLTDIGEPANQRRGLHLAQTEPEAASLLWPMSGKTKELVVDDGPSYVEKEHDKYRKLVALLQSGSEEEAIVVLRTLRSMAERGDLTSAVLLRAQPTLDTYSSRLPAPTLSPLDPANDVDVQRRLWHTLQDPEPVAGVILPLPRVASRPARPSMSETRIESPRFSPHIGAASDIGRYITSTHRREKRSE